ncbi:hypothetical protein AQUCO_01900146v1 [Aquilegia coerulea]|uniref:Uncharacterized protein n=1 Tax=Aquilegia coerulea TaxID=218851 RepID=A0A2G5DJ34_AQUCA|nr:hypothetical protein AQUCO_01900146v1 [Aquilegia coerulea]
MTDLASEGEFPPLPAKEIRSDQVQDVRSWTNLFEHNRSFGSNSLISFNAAVKEGLVEVPDEIVRKGIQEWEQVLVGFFIEKKRPFLMVRDSLLKSWNLKGVVEISTDEELYYFRFNESTDKFLKEDQFSLLLLNVPKSLWTREGLSFIASLVGEPISMDEQTASKRRLNFARICVEVPVNHEYKKVVFFSMKGKTVEIEVEYPWIPKSCTKCNQFRHSSLRCGLIPEVGKAPIKDMGKQSWKERARNHVWKKKAQVSDKGQTSEIRAEPVIAQQQVVRIIQHKEKEAVVTTTN